MKILKITLAAVIAFGFLAAGCAEKAPVETVQVKEAPAKKAHHSYSSKLGTESTKKDTKK
jgi:hypothetical protein